MTRTDRSRRGRRLLALGSATAVVAAGAWVAGSGAATAAGTATFALNNLTYQVTSSTPGDLEVMVVSATPSIATISVPPTIVDPGDGQTYTVTSVGEDAFAEFAGLTSIVLPSTLTSIGDSAFAEDPVLSSAVLPPALTSIGDGAFTNDPALSSVVFPDTLTSIGAAAYFDDSSITSLNIPDSVTSIGGSALYQDTALTTVALGSGLTSIPTFTFAHDTALTSVTIPDSVTSIGQSAFLFDSSLAAVEIPASVTSIGDLAFVDDALGSVLFDGDAPTFASSSVFDSDPSPLVRFHHRYVADFTAAPALSSLRLEPIVPTISAVTGTGDSGQIVAGQQVHVSGGDLDATSVVTIGTTPLTGVDHVSDTELVGTAPVTTSAGATSLTVTDLDGTSSPYGVTVVASAPTTTAPTITATPTSAAAPRNGWYRTPVTLTFTCRWRGVAMTPCPAAVHLSTDGRHTVTERVAAPDGTPSPTLTRVVDIDRTAPTLKIKGVKAGRKYAKRPKATCSAKDALSGVASCKVSHHRKKRTVTYTATATDRAGNVRTTVVKVKLR